MASPKQSRLERELETLRPALQSPDAPGSHALFGAALTRSQSFVAAKAATAIREHRLEGFEDDLKAAFDRFLRDPIKTDPGCLAKLATLEALDHLEVSDDAPFVKAIRHFQLEPAYKKPVDTAAGLRARGAMGLARLGHPDFLLLLADLLADPEPNVRQAAADALAFRGDRAGAATLQLKLNHGDEEPEVLLACLSGLVALAPDWGLRKAGALLAGKDEPMREIAAMALGESRRDDALDELFRALDDEVLSPRRALLLRAVAMHRSDRALEKLLAIIAAGARPDAEAAIEALAFRALEPGLHDRVMEAVKQSPHPALADAARAALDPRRPRESTE